MTIVKEALIIAGQLALLTYNIGVLLYMLPIPLRSIKSWAPRLIEDGIYAALLVTLFSTILYISDYIASLSTVTLERVAIWSYYIMGETIIIYMLVRAFAALLHIIPGGGYLAAMLVFPFGFIVFGIVSASATVQILVHIIHGLKAELAAIGVALYSLPFRIGRSAGASLIAFVVVANIMLHYLPHWVVLLVGGVASSWVTTGHDNPADMTLYTFWGIVRDSWGDTPRYGIVFFEMGNTTYSYPIGADGGYYALYPLAKGTYRVYVEYMGLTLTSAKVYYLIPEELKLTYEYSDYPLRLDIELPPNVKLLRPQGVLYSTAEIKKYSFISSATDSMEHFRVEFEMNYFVYGTVTVIVSLPEQCRVTSIEVDKLASNIDYNSIYKAWRGVPVYAHIYRFVVYNTPFSLKLEYECPRYYTPKEPSLTIPVNLDRTIPLGFMSLIVFGLTYAMSIYSYLAIMGMVILGVAHLLGAHHPRVVFRG